MKCIDQDIQLVLDFHQKLKPSKREFTGRELLNYLSENPRMKQLSRSELVKFAQEKYCSPNRFDNLIHPTKGTFILEDNTKKKYKFIQDIFEDFYSNKVILNLPPSNMKEKFFFEYEDEGKRPSLTILEKIQEFLGLMYAEFGNEKGTVLNYKKLYDSFVFNWKLLPLLRKLPFIDLKEMVGNEDLIKSFFLNVYNILMVHARSIEFNKTKFMKDLDFNQISFTYKYVIGGMLFDLNTIKNGILQGNRPFIQKVWKFKVCNSTKTTIDPVSPLSLLVLKKKDPRVNFALNLGTRSSPSISVYNEKELEFQLELATKNFVQAQVLIMSRKSSHTMLISKLFTFTTEEFGRDFDMIDFIIKHMRDLKYQARLQDDYKKNPNSLKITYSRYDWAINHSYI